MKKLALALLVVGLLPYGVMQTWVIAEQDTWHPLTYPISLEPGTIDSPQFKTRASTTYSILVEVNRSIDFQRTECLLGLESWPQNALCRNIPGVLDSSLRVTTDGKTNPTLQSFISGEYSDTIAKEIGRFDAREGQLNVIHLTINRNGSELNQAKPRLLVNVLPGYWEGTEILLQLTFFAAILLGIPGIVILCIPIVVRTTSRIRRTTIEEVKPK